MRNAAAFAVATSRDATEENQTTAADAGVDDFLTKPLDLPDLWTRLRVAERILRYTTQVRLLEEMLPICSYCLLSFSFCFTSRSKSLTAFSGRSEAA